MQQSIQFLTYKKVAEKESPVLIYDKIREIFRLRTSQDIEFLTKKDRIVNRIMQNLSDCGKFFTFDLHCKKCESEVSVVQDFSQPNTFKKVSQAQVEEARKKSFLKTVKVRKLCSIRYCDNVECVVDRFARTMEQLESIERLKPLRSLFHFSIGFPKIIIEDFPAKRKDFERVLHDFFAELRKAGITNSIIVMKKTLKEKKVLQGIKILDISKGKNKGVWDGLYFVHYHIMLIPFSREDTRGLYDKIQAVRAEVMSRQRNKIPFHVQIYGNKKKEAMFSYIALRSNGMYKPFESRKEEYFEAEDLRTQIKAGKFMFLKQIFSVEKFIELFYNRRFFSTLGGLPYGSRSPHNVSQLFDCKCRFHGDLTRFDLILRIEPCEDEKKPPDGLKSVQDGEVFVDEKVDVEEINMVVSDEDVKKLLVLKPEHEKPKVFDEYCSHCNNRVCVDGVSMCILKEDKRTRGYATLDEPGISYCSSFKKCRGDL